MRTSFLVGFASDYRSANPFVAPAARRSDPLYERADALLLQGRLSLEEFEMPHVVT